MAVLGSEPHAGGGVPACEWRMSPTAPCFAKLFSPQAPSHAVQKANEAFCKTQTEKIHRNISREYKDAGAFHTRTFRRRATRREG